jgi:hypothetical protein
MFRTEVAAQWLRPTWHATPLRPLLFVTASLMFITAVTSSAGLRASGVPGGVAAGALAAGVALGLDDEAHTMLGSSPTGALHRLGHRLLLLVPAVVAATAVLVASDRLLFDRRSEMPSALALAAIVATGVAVEVWWSRRRPDTAAEGAATVTMGWALAGPLVPDVTMIQRVADSWRLDAVWVLGMACLLVITGATSRPAWGRRPPGD